MAFKIGDLVESKKAFSGIGKIISMDEATGIGTVGFFESPIQSECRATDVNLAELTYAEIYDEANVYLQDDDTGLWRRARYGSKHPDGNHLVLFKKDEPAVVPVSDIYALNLGKKSSVDPLEFLEARCTDTPFFSDWRLPFSQSYIEQRAACRSISSILSSSVEIEPHQIAVVRRVLQDKSQKYLLADEVGLGKTIEACLILREHVLQDEDSAKVLVAVPEGLIGQWRSELINRFYLEDLLDEAVFVCSHEKLVGALEMSKPTMLVIDEAHQICRQAWSEESSESSDFSLIADAAQKAKTCLLLSGTPLTGNEKNFLAMLHLLSPNSYQLTEDGVNHFLTRLAERERLGGMYQALVVDNDNDTLTDIVEEISSLFPSDVDLLALIDATKPLIGWQASDEGVDRSTAIGNLRSYIGENYRLHQRMLRNRRVDPAISGLFPGLIGATKVPWIVDEESLSVDQLLDAFRDEFICEDMQSVAITSENYLVWVRAYLTSPMLLSRLASSAPSSDGDHLENWERGALENLARCADQEQVEKDHRFLEFVTEYLDCHKKAKIVVFCDDPVVADHVFEITSAICPDQVERYLPNEELQFGEDKNIRILVCDKRGEDGLNLHGGEKHLVHYAVPLSFAQIEQRNGRVNRYSAAIYARPIGSTVLLPNRQGMFTAWVELLDDVVGIFDRSVASLQYVLQEKIDDAWRRVTMHGIGPLSELGVELVGHDGLLERETRRVEAQEELNSMNEEVEHAKSFADALNEADEVAEVQAQKMSGWIRQALHFKQTPGNVPETFRFSYVSEGSRGRRTLVDVLSFLEKCITGIDRDESSWQEPVTALMSSNRQLVSHGRQIYPMRFGQPFIDTIFDLSRIDTRGICSVRLRAVDGMSAGEPKAYFNLSWIVSGCKPDAAPHIQRISDEKYVPRFVNQWLSEGGEVLSDAFLEAVLSASYSKKPVRLGKGLSYRDLNVSHNYWSQLEDYYPKSEWASLVRELVKKSRGTVDVEFATNGLGRSNTYGPQLEAASVVILIGSGQ